mgnify:CR=1 FL=1
MKVFVTGVGGQLGYDVMNELHQSCLLYTSDAADEL